MIQKQNSLKKPKWKIITFHKSPPPQTKPPKEFLCPISGSLMHDPVIITSGHSFERASVIACKSLNFTPTLLPANKTCLDFSTVIPNLALKSTILNWCKLNSLAPPKPLQLSAAENIVRLLMKEVAQTHQDSSSDESVATTMSTTPPMHPSITRPCCYYSASSSSELETLEANATCASREGEEKEADKFVLELMSPKVNEVEEALISLRKMTRTNEDTRAELCTQQLLSVLRSLITSKNTNIQVNSIACLVNLSLEPQNKVMIVRSGFVCLLIDLLKGGNAEAQEHACGAIFSLALDDHNKIAIGVLGALSPLLHLLRSESERIQKDSAVALYHLSLVQTNRSRLVKLGAIPLLLNMVKSGFMTSSVLLILCNLAFCTSCRPVILDCGGVECLVDLLRRDGSKYDSIKEKCMTMLYGLSYGGLRFKAVAKLAQVEDVLIEVEKDGSLKSKEKAKRIMDVIKGRMDEEEEEIDWEELLNSDSASQTRWRIAKDELNIESFRC